MTRVADLAGADIALWVGRIERLEDIELCGIEIGCRTTRCEYVKHEVAGDDGWWTEFSPHTDWEVGGPLIEKHRIWLQPVDAGGTWMGGHQPKAGWLARVAGAAVNERDEKPLVAAMRALVASVYGEHVPDEVQS